MTNKLLRIARGRTERELSGSCVWPATQIVHHPGRLVQFSRRRAGMSVGVPVERKAPAVSMSCCLRRPSVLQPPPYAVIGEPAAVTFQPLRARPTATGGVCGISMLKVSRLDACGNISSPPLLHFDRVGVWPCRKNLQWEGERKIWM